MVLQFFVYIFGKLVQMMSHIVRNRQHISNLLDKGNHGMDFHIHNVRNHFHRMSLKYRMDNAIHCIALAVVDIILHVMVDAKEEKFVEKKIHKI